MLEHKRDDDLTAPIEAALAATAASLDGSPGPNLLERPVEDALSAALAEPPWTDARRQHTIALTGWDGRLGAVDISATHDRSRVLFEAKSSGSSLWICAWDLAKLALCLAENEAELGVLVAAASTADWVRMPRGAELFEPRRWRADVLLDRFRGDFALWRREVATNPKSLPAAWSTFDLERYPFTVGDEPWELRAAAIGAVDDDQIPIEYVPVAADWRRDAANASGTTTPGVETLEIRGGSDLGPSFTVTWNGEELEYVTERSEDSAPERATARPTEREWRAFWHRLDLLDVWAWDSDYKPADISTDGYTWSISIVAGGRRCDSRGYSAWPGRDGVATWDAFMLALRDLLAGLPVW